MGICLIMRLYGAGSRHNLQQAARPKGSGRMKLVPLVAAWLIGTFIALEASVDTTALLLFLVASIILGAIFLLARFPITVPVLLLVLVLGALRTEGLSSPSAPLPEASKTVAVQGVVVSDPEASGGSVEFHLKMDQIEANGALVEADGKLLVYARPPLELAADRYAPFFNYGDYLELTGSIEQPDSTGGFDYGRYLANQGIVGIMGQPEVRYLGEGGGSPFLGAVYSARERLSDSLEHILPDPQSALAKALLLGKRGDLPTDVTDAFRNTGTSHLLAISGLHVGVLLLITMGGAVWLLGKRRQLYLVLPLCVIWGYALISGLSASVERAAIMGTIYLAAHAIGRPRSAFPALALAAGVMVGLQPAALQDISFQLSFAAMAGIALLFSSEGRWWSRYVHNSYEGGASGDVKRFLTLAIATSIAATVLTLPLVAFNFQQVPTVGVAATVLALPAMPFLLVSAAVTAAVGVALPELGQGMGWFPWLFLEYLARLTDLFSRIPGSTLSVPPMSGLFVWAYYGLLGLMLAFPLNVKGRAAGAGRWFVETLAALRRPELGYQRRTLQAGGYVALMTGASVAAVLAWSAALDSSDRMLSVTFLDIGQGQSIFIEGPGGSQMLVDGGPSPKDAARSIGGIMGPLDRSLDVVVLTHPDEDHFRGLSEVVRRYDVGLALEGPGETENALYEEWRSAIEAEQVRKLDASAGHSFVMDGGVKVDVLNPVPGLSGLASNNNNSLLLMLTYGDISFLLTADIEAEAERRLIREGASLDAEVLQVPHHGSRTSTTPGFLGHVSPVAAVISSGANNPYGHPHPDVVARLQASVGAEMIYNTAQSGDIRFITDGVRLWVSHSK